MSILFEGHQLVRASKTGIGYYEKILLDKVQNGVKDTVTIGLYNDSEKTRLHNTRSKFTYKLIKKIQAYGLPIHVKSVWKDNYKSYVFPDFSMLELPSSAISFVVIHDLAFLKCPQFLPKRNALLSLFVPDLTKYLRKTVNRSVNDATYIVTTSIAVKNEIIEYYKIDEKRIITTGIPPEDSFTKNNSSKLPFELPTNKYFFFQATLEPRKNHITLVKAYAQLSEKIRNEYSLVLGGGSGWDNYDLMKYIIRLQKRGYNIVLAGYINDQDRSSVYSKASLYIQPSHYEGFGMPLLEAMACETPVICSDIPVFKEVAGNAALFFDKDSPEDIAKTIQEGLKADAKLVAKGRLRHEFYRKNSAGFDKIASVLNNTSRETTS